MHAACGDALVSADTPRTHQRRAGDLLRKEWPLAGGWIAGDGV
jgi:hypothetical protein